MIDQTPMKKITLKIPESLFLQIERFRDASAKKQSREVSFNETMVTLISIGLGVGEKLQKVVEFLRKKTGEEES